jgi:2-polyprenyl-6-methoxyphenol hydroxylase-like FAD-dependent oxidoreductase
VVGLWWTLHVSDAPFVIAGAGIAGLALATALHRDGRPSVLLDERPGLGSSGGAITLWPNALAALDAIGVGDDVRRAGNAFVAGSVRTAGGRVLRTVDPVRLERALGEPLVAIRRGVLVELLHRRLPPGSITFGRSVRSHRVTRGADDRADDRVGTRVEVTLDDGSTLGASALVGADGFRSAVARTLGGGLRERYAGYPAWRGIAPIGAPAAGGHPASGEFWGAGQEFGVVPLDRETSYWFAARHEPEGQVAPGGELAYLRRVFAGWPAEVRALLAATPEDAVSRVDVLDRATPAVWCDGPVTVIGDAAHAMRPHLGQGGCQALVDAAVLARRLRSPSPDVSAAGQVDAAFAAYAAARRRPALRVARLTRAAGRLVHTATPLHRALPLVPEPLFLRRLAAVGGAGAFRP